MLPDVYSQQFDRQYKAVRQAASRTRKPRLGSSIRPTIYFSDLNDLNDLAAELGKARR
jgi:hypothetical protein